MPIRAATELPDADEEPPFDTHHCMHCGAFLPVKPTRRGWDVFHQMRYWAWRCSRCGKETTEAMD